MSLYTLVVREETSRASRYKSRLVSVTTVAVRETVSTRESRLTVVSCRICKCSSKSVLCRTKCSSDKDTEEEEEEEEENKIEEGNGNTGGSDVCM